MQGKMDKYNGNRAVIEITGQIGKLSDLKSSKNGRDFVEFSLYTLINKQRYWYNNLIAYDTNAKELSSYAHKNTKATVYAFPEEKSWQDKDGSKRVKYLNHVTGLSLHLNDIKPKIESTVAAKEHYNEEQTKILAVIDLWSKSISLDGTIGQRYLTEYRGLYDTSNLEIRFVPKDTKISLSDGSIKPSFAPMIVIAGYNDKNELVSSQRIYLDQKTANKNSYIDTPKLSMGLIGGSAGLIQQGSSKILYLAEGAETAASRAQVKKDDWIYYTFGLGNLRKLGNFIKLHKFEEVILGADNDADNPNTKKLIDDAIDELGKQGIYLRVIYPPLLDGLEKSDWNDVLVLLGQQKLRDYLEK